MASAYIVDDVRWPPIAAFNGAMTAVRPDDLAGKVLRELVRGTRVDKEAFAWRAPTCCRDLEIGADRRNADGGALALGLPWGAPGARPPVQAARLIERQGGRHALAAQGIGGGEGAAVVLEAA